MEAVKVKATLEEDGKVTVNGLPYRRGQQVELIVRRAARHGRGREPLTARKLLESGLVGLWRNRADIVDSSEYARKLREEAQNRRRTE